MKIANLPQCDYAYEIFPKVACKGEETSFSARGLGVETALRPNAQYCFRVIPQEENNSSLLLDFSDWKRYDGIFAEADENGFLHFSYTFNREQIYTLRLAQCTDGEWEALYDFRVFCAEKDLFERTPLRGNTHCHVCESADGHEDPFFAACMYRKAGFDYLAVTDHHRIDGSVTAVETAGKIPSGLSLFYGEEVHVPNAYIHAVNVGARFENGKGLDVYFHLHEEECMRAVAQIAEEYADRLPAGVPAMDFAYRKWIADQIHAQGGIAILAHPFWEWDAHNTRDDVFRFLAEEKIYDAAEILHGMEKNCRDANMQMAFWNDMRADGIYISPVGVDDAHRRYFRWDYESSFNEVFTLIFARENTLQGFAEALQNGYSAAVEGYENAPDHVVATYRLTKYALFLLDHYFPFHDELCFAESLCMRDAYFGDEQALQLLPQLTDRVKRYTDRFFGRV